MGVTVIILIFLTINLAFLHRQSPEGIPLDFPYLTKLPVDCITFSASSCCRQQCSSYSPDSTPSSFVK
jgi:hypothetical protein